MKRRVPLSIVVVSWLALVVLRAAMSADSTCFEIQVVDDHTDRGVPLVELKTVNDIRFYTDSAGRVAFNEPGLMNRRVFFSISSHGYEFPRDGFGIRGRRLMTTPGTRAVLKIKRINVAERLYRVTGAGIYRDSILLGYKSPIRQPLLNGQVFGSDSVVNTIYRGRIYWFWGDTNRPSYPLGNFHVSGATSAIPGKGGLDPLAGVDLEYLVDEKGFARPTCKMPGKGPTWIDGLMAVVDKEGRERLFAKYVKVQPPLTIYERGLVEFDDRQQAFVKRTQFSMQAPLFPAGHPLRHRVAGIDYFYFPRPYPTVRVRARVDWLGDPSRYEAYSPFKPGSTAETFSLDRDEQGQLKYSWKRDTLPLTLRRQQELVKAGRMTTGEGLFRMRDVETNKPVAVHRGSVYFNAFRKRWIMIALETFGISSLGEIWYSEAPNPEGPWRVGRKIVTHRKYSFYNPKHHPMFDSHGGRYILFEGTYTNMFSGNPDQTPRYNYNQVMYRLDLADPRLKRAQDLALSSDVPGR